MTTRSTTQTLVGALHVLARDIESDDGLANAAISEAAERLQELKILLCQCWPHVYASHGAEHMMDGFKPKIRPEIDSLFNRVKQEVDQ